MKLKNHDIHIWTIELSINEQQEMELIHFLDDKECKRAQRFKQPIHRQRFIAAHSALKFLLSLYLNIPSNQIEFSYNDYRKPFLKKSILPLQFNMSHSYDIAVIAFTLNHAIGVDIEKIRSTYNPAIAKRYFSLQENISLTQLNNYERVNYFYHLWASKEALIKAVGKGLALDLSQFSIQLKPSEEIILENKSWTLSPLSLHPDFAAAVATQQRLTTISYHKLLLRNNHWITG